MADIETARENVLNSSFDDVSKQFKRINHHDPDDNTVAMAYNEQVANFEQNKLDKLYDLEKLEMEQAYNSPAAQKQRYLEAGFNPVLSMYGGADAGNIQNASSPSSHGFSGAASAVAQGSMASTARINSVISGAGQLNDSISDYYKNLVMNEKAQQEHFNTQTQALQFSNDVREQLNRIEKQGYDNESARINRDALKNALYVSDQTLGAQVQEPYLNNRLISSNIEKINSEKEFTDARTQTENLMRDINRVAAEKGIKLTEAQTSYWYNAAQKISWEAQQVQQQVEAWDEYGHTWDKKYKDAQWNQLSEEVTRLQRTTEGYVEKFYKEVGLSDEALKQAINRTQGEFNRFMYERNKLGFGGNFGSEVLGTVSTVTDIIGNIFSVGTSF